MAQPERLVQGDRGCWAGKLGPCPVGEVELVPSAGRGGWERLLGRTHCHHSACLRPLGRWHSMGCQGLWRFQAMGPPIPRPHLPKHRKGKEAAPRLEKAMFLQGHWNEHLPAAQRLRGHWFFCLPCQGNPASQHQALRPHLNEGER